MKKIIIVHHNDMKIVMVDVSFKMPKVNNFCLLKAEACSDIKVLANP
jgi:hypothetical protein